MDWRNLPKHLLVEGSDDLHSVVGLMSEHITWPKRREEAPPVFIDDCRGCENILAGDALLRRVKDRKIQVLGVLLDADGEEGQASPDRRYQRLHQVCSEFFSTMPSVLSSDGLVVENEKGKRFGAWIMPDNVQNGMLETFLKRLIRDGDKPWEHALISASAAKEIGAPYRDVHREKAELHTWLAWQDPPGRPFGIALTARCLDPHSPYARPFIAWFKRLYDLA